LVVLEKLFEIQHKGCWLWTAGVNADGVAQVGTLGRTTTAARALWSAHVGPIPERHWVCRTCTEKLCVNPAHHELRTPGEHRRAIGRVRGNARLELPDVVEIKRLLTDGEEQAVIATRYGVSPSTVGAIAREATWTDVPWPGGDP
jgi:hypothetical protein